MGQLGRFNSSIIRFCYLTFAIIAFVILPQGCQEDSKKPSPENEVTVNRTKRSIPPFDGNRAYANIQAQLDFGFRVPGTEAHTQVIEWITNEMEKNGAKVIQQKFKADFLSEKNVQCTNIMAQLHPERTERVLLAAHFDSRMVAEKDDERQDEPIPGADDGGSGVAVMIELARIVNEQGIDIGVDFLFFDAEDQGDPDVHDNWALGSKFWSNNLAPKNYTAEFGILLDMVGSKNASFGREGNSLKYARNLQSKIWKLAQSMGYSDYFQDFITGGVMDDHVFVNENAKIPMVDIINISPDDRRSFGEYHHTHEDNMDIISKRTLRVVGQVVLAVLYNQSNGTF